MDKVQCQKMGVKKSGRTARQLLMSKLNQRRYRERERQRKKEMEGLYDSLQHVCAALDAVQEENAALRVNNCRLQSMIEKHQTIVRSLEGGIHNLPAGHAGTLQPSFALEGNVVDMPLSCSSPQSMGTSLPLDVMNSTTGLDTTCQVMKPHHVLMNEMDAHVQTIRNLLDANGIFISGVQPTQEVNHVLQNLLARAAEMTAGIFDSKAAHMNKHGGSGVCVPQMGMDEEDMVNWAQFLPILNLTGQQKVAIMNVRTEYLSMLFKIHEERAVLNEQAASAIQESSENVVPVRQSMHSVWDQLKRNVRQENDLMAQALRVLFFNILDLTQAAFLTVETHPGGVDIMKLASAISALDANCGAPAVAEPSTRLDNFESPMRIPPAVTI